MAIQQRPCGHLVPASFVRCPTCGAVIGSAPPDPVGPEGGSGKVLAVAVVVVLVLVAVGAGAVVWSSRGSSSEAAEGRAPSTTSTTTTTLPTRRSGPGTLVGLVLPLDEVGLTPPGGSLPNVRAGHEVRWGPAEGEQRRWVTAPSTGIAFAPFDGDSVLPVIQAPGGTPGDPCGRHIWTFTAGGDEYLEEVEFCEGAPGATAPAIATAEAARRGARVGTVRPVEVDGHPGAMVVSMRNPDGTDTNDDGNMHPITTHVVVDTGKGFLHLSGEVLLLEGAGAVDLAPLLDTVRIP